MPALLAGLALEAAYAAVAARTPDRDEVYGTLLLHFAACLLYLAAAAISSRTPPSGRAIVAFALVFRATLIAAPPLLSTDIWRYVWEGRVQVHGKNPYAHAPADLESSIPDEAYARMEHRLVPAVYGPLAEMSFVPAALLPAPARPYALKAQHALADLAIVVLLLRLLGRRGLPGWWALLYGWHPLPVLEVAGEGHLDAVPIALVLVSLEALESRRPTLAGAALGLAAASKWLPLVLLPWLWRRAGWRAVVAALVACALPALPYLPEGPFGVGLGRYATEWRFNATGFLIVSWALPDLAARVVSGVLALATGSLRGNPERVALATFGVVLALSPVVHPWYVLWVLPFAILGRSLAFLELSLAAPLAYAVLLGYEGTKETWHEPAWPRVLWIVPFIALLLREVRKLEPE